MNITFDLETLGKGDKAAVVQLGAVKFKNDGELVDQFFVNINPNDYTGTNFEVDFSTIEWWLQRDKEAIDSVFGKDLVQTDYKTAIDEFVDWLEQDGYSKDDYNYWSHAFFDPPKLKYLFEEAGWDPIYYRQHKDIRTLTHLYEYKYNMKFDDLPREGIHHNALDDSLYQAKYISTILTRLKEL